MKGDMETRRVECLTCLMFSSQQQREIVKFHPNPFNIKEAELRLLFWNNRTDLHSRKKVSKNVGLLLLNGTFESFQTPTQTSQQLPTMPPPQSLTLISVPIF